MATKASDSGMSRNRVRTRPRRMFALVTALLPLADLPDLAVLADLAGLAASAGGKLARTRTTQAGPMRTLRGMRLSFAGNPLDANARTGGGSGTGRTAKAGPVPTRWPDLGKVPGLRRTNGVSK